MMTAAAAFLAAGCDDDDSTSYTLRVLTFEDSDYKGTAAVQSSGTASWSSLVDDAQYGGRQLYGESGSGSTDANFYYWRDQHNTELSSGLAYNWGSWCYWGGGHAVSDYVAGSLTGITYQDQLAVLKKGAQTGRTGGGHNGSDRFCVHNGFADGSAYSATELPGWKFADGSAHVIDHMWVNNTAYNLSCYYTGNDFTPPITDGEWVKLIATGSLNGQETGSCSIYLCNGPKKIVTDWTRWDLSGLGTVDEVRFNVTGSSVQNGTFSQPAYFAYDDVAVRFENK